MSRERLQRQLSGYRTVAVAFSGGVDSTLLLDLAREVLGADHVIALTAVTPYMVRQEIADAISVASELGVRHELVELPMPEGMERNPQDRCYRCKHAMYGRLRETAADLGFQVLLDASNSDDVDDFRPGLQASQELEVRSPFIDFGIDKAAIRALSRERGLSTADKPTNVCLLTRLQFDEPVLMDRLQRIEEAERALTARGYPGVRVRCHCGEVARVEVAPGQRVKLLADAEAVVRELRSLGFRYVAMDLLGYQLGSMNEPRR